MDNSFEGLPYEMVLEILMCVDFEGLKSLIFTSKFFYSILREDNIYFWRRKHNFDFPIDNQYSSCSWKDSWIRHSIKSLPQIITDILLDSHFSMGGFSYTSFDHFFEPFKEHKIYKAIEMAERFIEERNLEEELDEESEDSEWIGNIEVVLRANRDEDKENEYKIDVGIQKIFFHPTWSLHEEEVAELPLYFNFTREELYLFIGRYLELNAHRSVYSRYMNQDIESYRKFVVEFYPDELLAIFDISDDAMTKIKDSTGDLFDRFFIKHKKFDMEAVKYFDNNYLHIDRSRCNR